MSDDSMVVNAGPIAIDMDIGTEYHTYPNYHGNTTVVPSDNYQVLYTKNKLLTENIVVAPNPKTSKDFIIKVSSPGAGQPYSADKTIIEILQAIQQGDSIWFQLGVQNPLGPRSLQRAVIDDSENPRQLAAVFAGNFGSGYGFYTVYYTLTGGVVVNFKASLV